MWYAYSENFVLPLSHDEVVHGKGSLWCKMPGEKWQKAANLRLLFGWLFGHPGKKLVFMGCEFGQEREWNHDISLDWHISKEGLHSGMALWFRDINRFYRDNAPLWEMDYEQGGFEWVDCDDSASSVISFMRRDKSGKEVMLVYNFTPVLRNGYRIGVLNGKAWREVLNSDASCYGGTNTGNLGYVKTEKVSYKGRPYSLSLTLPPLACLVLVPDCSEKA